MKTALWTAAALGLAAILITIAPDVRRYMRMRSM
jgi:hypothetical protein